MGKMYWKRWDAWWEIDTNEDLKEFISWSLADYAARVILNPPDLLPAYLSVTGVTADYGSTALLLSKL